MYLVELRPGKEELYRSSDELALAIRNGDVDARSRVYHRATAKWISITLHPQYRAIVAAAKEDDSRPARRGWSILGGTSDQPKRGPEASSSGTTGQFVYRWRRPLTLGITVLLLMSGVQLAFSGPRPPWSGRPERVASAVPTARTSSNSVRRAETSPAAQPMTVSSLPTLVSLASTSRVIPQAPKLRPKLLSDALTPGKVTPVDASSPDALIARYEVARDSARRRLESSLRVARLSRLFASSRLSPDGGVTDTRMSLAGVANALRIYRQQQATIERAYQDSVTAMAKAQKWSPRKVRTWYSRTQQREAPTLVALSSALLASIDSLFGVLDQEAGAYKLRGTAIAFEDPSAGEAYGALRRRIKEQIDAAVAVGGATSPGPTGLLLQAIGTTTLPRET